jgi:hypothetical protein
MSLKCVKRDEINIFFTLKDQKKKEEEEGKIGMSKVVK